MAPIRITGDALAFATPDQRYVQSLYSALFNRRPSPAALANGVTFLQSGGGRPALVRSLCATGNDTQGIVSQVYTEYLQRAPSGYELAQWSNQLSAGFPVSTLVVIILSSPEYYKLATS